MRACLDGVHVLEFAALGPAPFAAMVLADMGARVTRITRPGSDEGRAPPSFLSRGKTIVELDLKRPKGRAKALELVRSADVVVEGLRPGAMEALGLGPQDLFAVRPKLIYGRMTGWGQSGPDALKAGHDINFLAVSGILGLLGPADRPPSPPLNLVSDFGGGGLYLALGIVGALLRARSQPGGQIVDAAMIHGVTHLSTFIHAQFAKGAWNEGRESNLVDGGAPFYRTYETSDGRYMAVGSIEPRFFDSLVSVLGLKDEYGSRQWERQCWPALRNRMASVFRTASRDAWTTRFDQVDACVTPVLSIAESYAHPQMAGCFITNAEGIREPAPAPRVLSVI